MEMAGDNGEAPGSDEDEAEAAEPSPEARGGKRPRPPKGRPPKQEAQEARADPIKINAGLAVLSLGRVEWVHPAFHSAKHIFPVGYRALRLAASPASGGKEAPHTCEILASPDGMGPVFRWGLGARQRERQLCWKPGPALCLVLYCFWLKDEQPVLSCFVDAFPHRTILPCRVTPKGRPAVEGSSMAVAWAALSGPAAAAAASPSGATGAAMFGLSSARVARLIEGLPGAERCEHYAGWPEGARPEAPALVSRASSPADSGKFLLSRRTSSSKGGICSLLCGDAADGSDLNVCMAQCRFLSLAPPHHHADPLGGAGAAGGGGGYVPAAAPAPPRGSAWW